MAEGGSLIPAIMASSDAEAVKAVADLGSSVIGTVRDTGRFVAEVVGDAPKNAFGILSDQLAAARAIGAIRLQKKVEAERKRLDIQDPQTASPSIAQPLLEAALNETREDLQDIWARLIVTATDPKRAHLVRQSFIDTLKQFDPYDALVLRARGNIPGRTQGNMLQILAESTKLPQDEVMLSFLHLRDLKCLESKGSIANIYLTPYADGLLRACILD